MAIAIAALLRFASTGSPGERHNFRSASFALCSPHRLRCRRKKLPAAIPALYPVPCPPVPCPLSSLGSLILRFFGLCPPASHTPHAPARSPATSGRGSPAPARRRQLPQFLILQRQQLLRRLRIALFNLRKNAQCHIGHVQQDSQPTGHCQKCDYAKYR